MADPISIKNSDRCLKGALDNFSLILRFFLLKKAEILIPLEVFTYVVTACLILLATSTLLRRYIFLAAAFLKIHL